MRRTSDRSQQQFVARFDRNVAGMAEWSLGARRARAGRCVVRRHGVRAPVGGVAGLLA